MLLLDGDLVREGGTQIDLEQLTGPDGPDCSMRELAEQWRRPQRVWRCH
jgi:hypothetical protein